MIEGTVTDDGIPVIMLEIAGQQLTAVIDTGFNGDLELPQSIMTNLELTSLGPDQSVLAAGQEVIETLYAIRFTFDGEDLRAEATFAPVSEALLGTRLLRRHRLEVDFPESKVLLTRA